MEGLFASLGLLLVVGVLIVLLRDLAGRRIHVLDFQAGVKFEDGGFAQVLDPGCYRIRLGREQVEIVDLRPQLFLFETLHFEDALGHTVLLSCTGELVVKDPRTAVATFRTETDELSARVPQLVRDAVSRCVVQSTDETGLRTLKGTLVQDLEAQLLPFGVGLTNFEVNELWAAPMTARATLGTA